MLAFALTAITLFVLLGCAIVYAFRAHSLHYRGALACWGVLVVMSSAIYLAIGDIDSLINPPKLTQPTVAPGAIDMEQLANGVLMVEREVAADPTYALGWLMLARSYWLLQRADDSARAYGNYHELEAGDISSWISYAQTLLALEPPEPQLALDYFERALAEEPSNLGALGFAGYAATLVADYQAAINYWESLLPFVADEPEASALLQEQIDQARAELRAK